MIGSRQGIRKLMLLVLFSLMYTVAVSCASEEAVPTPVPASAIADIVKQAVTEAAGPSAVEIRGMVRDAVAAAVPAATDPAEIQRMVQAAVAAGPGVSKADLEATIARQAGQQMTAADVKNVVDAAIAAMPAPKIDTSAMRPLVEQAIASAVPPGTSLAEMQRLVEAAVTAATKGVPTRGELEASIAKAVEGASAGQLTATDIQNIVDASMAAAVEEVAAKAAEQAVSMMPARQPSGTFIIPPALEKPIIPAGITRAQDQKISFVYHSRRAYLSPWKTAGFIENAWNRWVYMPPFLFSKEGEIRRGMALSYDITNDAKTYTVHLDPNAVFSDGTPVTAADVKAAWEFGALPENQVSWGGSQDYVNPIEGMKVVSAGDVLEATGLVALDDHTLQINLEEPSYTWPFNMGLWFTGVFKAEQFKTDPDYELPPHRRGSLPGRL